MNTLKKLIDITPRYISGFQRTHHIHCEKNYILFSIFEILKTYDHSQEEKLKEYINIVLENLPINVQDFIQIAQITASKKYLNNKYLSKEIYQKALDHNFLDLEVCEIANSIADIKYLGDVDWAKSIYNDILHNSTKGDDFSKYLLIAQTLNCKELRKKTYWLSIQYKNILNSELKEADTIYLLLCDFVKIDKKESKLFIKQYLKTKYDEVYIYDIAKLVLDSMNDIQFVKEIYEHILNRSDKNFSDISNLCNTLRNKKLSSHKKWMRKMYSILLAKAECSNDVIQIANSIAAKEGLNDKKWVQEIKKNPYSYLLNFTQKYE